MWWDHLQHHLAIICGVSVPIPKTIRDTKRKEQLNSCAIYLVWNNAKSVKKKTLIKDLIDKMFLSNHYLKFATNCTQMREWHYQKDAHLKMKLNTREQDTVYFDKKISTLNVPTIGSNAPCMVHGGYI